MIYIPRPYQKDLWRFGLDVHRAGWMAGMGLGKTGATYSLIDTLHFFGEIERVLVLAPKRVAVSTWPREAEKWENFHHLRPAVVCGPKDKRLQALASRSPIHVTNYENLPWLIAQWGEEWPYDMVVADESTKLKGFRLGGAEGKRARALSKVAYGRTRRWLNLTGTPAPNGLMDLWGQTWFQDRGSRLGRTFGAFQQRWFYPLKMDYGAKWLPFACAQDQIHEALADISLGMEAKDHFDLPELVLNTVEVDLPPKAREAYRTMEDEMFAELVSGDIQVWDAGARTQKCLQIASGAAYIDDAGNWSPVHDAKLEALDDIIEEAAGMPVLVGYHFKSDLARLRQHLGPRAFTLDDAPDIEARWNRGELPVLLANPASAGHGLNLQDGSNICVFFSHTWNLEHYLQFIERIGPVRQVQSGYNRPVFVHHIVARDTLDEVVMVRRDSKREVQDLLVDYMKKRR